MNLKLLGAAAGGLIVSLALIAGHEYGAAHAPDSECAELGRMNNQIIANQQRTINEMTEVIVRQHEQLNTLRADVKPMHNTSGGYIAACGTLPGVLGDDC